MEQFDLTFEKTAEEPATKPTAGTPKAFPKKKAKKPVKKPVSKTVTVKPVAEEKPALEEQPKPAVSKDPHVFTVSEITSSVKGMLDRNFSDVWVVGEVSNFRNPKSRHYYFSLKDENSQLNAVMFNGSGRIKFDLVDGLEVVCRGSVTVYAARGQYQIIIDECHPKGKGALQLAFEQLKKKLDEEGLFSKEHKKPIPYLPKKIGVVTSPTGAAVRDIIHVLTRRYPGIEILLYPAKVQGEGAGEEVAYAIGELNKRDDIDVLIVGRGGGSLEDLWAFNEEVTARAIFNSRIPVISAVGHEIDFTIADFVADERAPTPSAAAEIAVPVLDDLKRSIHDRRRQLVLALQNRVVHGANELARLKQRIPDPRKVIPDFIQRVDGFRERLSFSANVMLEKHEKCLNSFMDNLKHLSPLNILEKGYAVVQKEGGAVVKDAAALAVNDGVDLVFHKGRAAAKISKINK